MEEIEGKITRILFQAPDSLYTVAHFKVDGTNESVTVVGNLPERVLNSRWTLQGEFASHPRYGEQFAFRQAQRQLPQERDGVIAFLSSGHFTGIGKKTAEKIYDALGDHVLETIASNPSVLISTCKLPQAKADEIAKGMQDYRSVSGILTSLLRFGLSDKDILLLQKKYRSKLSEQLNEDCFDPLYTISNFGYEAVLQLADGFEIPATDIRRLEAALYNELRQMVFNSGNTYIPKKDLMERFSQIPMQELNAALDHLIDRNRIEQQEDRLYPFRFLEEEQTIARHLYSHVYPVEKPDPVQLAQLISKIEKKEAIHYDPVQIEGVQSFFDHSVMVLNGGPGTGKSTTVSCILECIESLFPASKVQLCAPTGRAAKRMSELSGHTAKTIHSLLMWDADTGRFSKNSQDPLVCDFLIIDEFSMVDTHVFASLLNALPSYCRILMIGDEDQLPSVQPGQVFNDIIDSNQIPIVRLKTLFRQSKGSGIARLASDIRQENPLHYEDGVSFSSLEGEQIPDMLMKIVRNEADPQQIQILAPKYKGAAGINQINVMMQELLNPFDPNKGEIRIGSVTFREGDRVLLKKNLPEEEVYNGDIGIISEVDQMSKTILVEFDDAEVEFEKDISTMISHAWCMSIHKSQGSEYQHVAVIVDREAGFMLNKRLLYTAISRAKKKLDLLGQRELFELCVKRSPMFQRKTSLKEKIIQVFQS